MGGGLSWPIPVSRGIRQGCPLSCQLYRIATESLLFNICKTLSGFIVSGFSQNSSISVSAYADDVTVFVNHAQDTKALSNVLHAYEKASSAKLGKKGGFLERFFMKISQSCQEFWRNREVLGIYFGSSEFQKLH